MQTILFQSRQNDRVEFKHSEEQVWLESLFGLPVANHSHRTSGPAFISAGGQRFEGGDFRKSGINREGDRLSVLWQVGESTLQLRSEWVFCPETGVLRRQDTLINTGTVPVTVNRVLMRLGFGPGQYEAFCQHNLWATENQGRWVPLHTGGLTLEAEAGRTTQGSSPYACLRETDQGRGVVFHVLPFGNWRIRFMIRHTMVAVELGPSDEDFRLVLEPNQSWTGPEILLHPLTGGKPERAAAALHHYINERLGPAKETSVVYNTWLDQFDNLEPERLRLQLAAARDLGCEVFVIDAGWFGAGHGDWFDMTGKWEESTTTAFRGKMREFAAEVRQAGLGFGLWMEAEHFGPAAPLRTSHPEWFTGGAGKPRFDLENPEAYAWLEKEIRRLIETYELVWIKLDFNIELGFDERGLELSGYYRAWFRMLDALRAAYPGTFFEGCSSGGMRLDLEILRHFDGHFLTDTTNTMDVIRIFEGAVLRLPPGRLGKWCVLRSYGQIVPEYPGIVATAPESVGVPPATGWQPVQLTETVDPDLAMIAMIPGMLGFSGDPAGMSAEMRGRLGKHVEFYKSWRSFISGASAHLLTPTRLIGDRSGWSVLQLTHPKRRESLVFAIRLQDPRVRQIFSLYDLNPERRYEVRVHPDRGGVEVPIIDGETLMEVGLELTVDLPGQARIYLLTPVEEK